MDMTAMGRRYVERWFWMLDELAEAVGISPGEILDLIAAGCAPGPIYVLAGKEWWSALGDAPAPDGESW